MINSLQNLSLMHLNAVCNARIFKIYFCMGKLSLFILVLRTLAMFGRYVLFVTITLSTLAMFPANVFLCERQTGGFVFLSCMDLCACEIMNRISDLTNLINIKC